ncbi:homeobox protein MSX-3 [Leptinotarsa decemlineata]|uniref:homeobox protein MSX-3 n=1 Tax=Leptinotarsa decemlineata TaxID=7539 RepID=UPI003D30B3C9
MILRMENENDPTTRSLSDFSIEHILNRAGGETQKEAKIDENSEDPKGSNPFSWLHCTRFCPPRVPMTLGINKRDTPQKRQLGRYPRIPFTNQQIAILEEKFQESPYLSSEEAINLSKMLHLAEVKVKIWFQNRRARKRREEMGLLRKDSRKYPSPVEGSCGSRQAQKELTRGSDGASSTITSFVTSEPQVSMPFLYVSPPNILDFSHR